MRYDHEAGGTSGGDDPSEAAPPWDLSDLYASTDSPELQADLADAQEEADAIAEAYKGRVVELHGDELAEMLERYETLDTTLGRVASYAQLLFAAERDSETVARFYQTVHEKLNEAGTAILFVTLEINRIEDDALEAMIEAAPRLARFRPWLRDVRSFRPHQLSDEAETLLHEKSVAGRSAWVRLFDQSMAALRFPLDDKQVTSAEIFDLMSSPDRSVRAKAYAGIAQVLGQNVRLMAHITNTLAKDKQIEDGWRHFPRPISARNLSNQVEDEVVDALIGAVRTAYPDLAHRYYGLKATWLGLDKLTAYDRNAPLPEDDDRRIAWGDARELVLDAYGAFSPTLADIVRNFFRNQWIDAELRPGKDSGAFCHPTVPAVHPYVLMNYQGRQRDVMTLAHELGHGVHQVLAGRHGPLMSSTPLTLAETASVFGEQLTFQSLLAAETDERRKRVLLASKIEDGLNTVVRQIAFCDFERRVHDARREGELTTEQLGDIWMAVQTESLGPAFDFDDGYRTFWSYIPHFIHSPFYVYAYAFGDCLVNSLYAVYQEHPDGFEARYLDLLKAGGTLRHKELLAPFGLDASDPGFWLKGLGLIGQMIDRLESTLETN
ncbi:M3 family oligoendopeptidase [Marinivivus vitaminiproducens]|uniref:M3 family oligoendopeptidase n=1 Tax=Marinivivus vitaminiproducens TaxID=3035935 RepID=UPI00279EC528|nr:M3 family oligoendopeptidase [Geminicoccaceae bacterium SCSIO 64248]